MAFPPFLMDIIKAFFAIGVRVARPNHPNLAFFDLPAIK